MEAIMADYFVVIDVRIEDMDRYKDYMAAAKSAITDNGGEYLVRGGDLTVIEGENFKPTRLVLLKFPSEQHFRDWYYSDEYQAARAIRLPVSDMTMVGVNGIE
jgi:uncharacterized protein (DUF1330 family)